MKNCNLIDSCFFYNELIPDIPHTTVYLRNNYCMNDFKGCTRYCYAKLHGQDNVPNDLFPNDLFMHLLIDLPEIRKS
jgi:hypothetical protein